MGDGNRSFVVIGGARGIGAAIAVAEAAKGNRGFIGDMLPREQADDSLKPYLESGQVGYGTMNVTDQASVDQFRDAAVDALGTDKPLALVKMAGISKRGDLTKLEDFQGVRLMVDINVTGDERVTGAFADALKSSKGTVVLASSIVAESGHSTQGDQFYQMTKLQAWYQSAAILHDEGRFAGVCGWAVAPGLVITDLTLKEVTFPATMIPTVRMAAQDQTLRAELAAAAGIDADAMPSTATEILYATHAEALQALDGHDGLKKLLDKDPGLGMRTAGVFLNRAARDPKTRATNATMVQRSAQLLEALDVAIRPSVVADLVSAQLDAGKPPSLGILKAYSKGGNNRITKVGLG
ncbi:MAG: SDR family oxidoreductase [Myxococcales bacterium]|nr:SDR family oxidoreductase [Myxococcales bacterium]